MIRFLVKLIAWLALVGFSWLIVENSLPYLGTRADIPFLEERPWLAAQPLWRATVAVHAAGGVVCLLSCLLQFYRPLMRRAPAAHRLLGLAYVHSVLWVLCPSGFYMAFFAKGGWSGVAGFLLLGVVTFWTTWRGWTAMRKSRTHDHVIWMIRSFAMVTTAITFRIYNIALYELGMSLDTGYQAALGLSLAGNAAAAEWILFRMQSHANSKPQNAKTHENQNHIPDHNSVRQHIPARKTRVEAFNR